MADSGAYVDFNQGLDIRLWTEEVSEYFRKIKIKSVHFAWDNYEDKDIVCPKFELFERDFGKQYSRRKVQCYVLCGDHERKVREEDLYRIMWLREHNINPYVMLYDKEHLPKGHELKQLQRWCNSKFIFWSCETFEDYKKYMKGEIDGT